MSDGARAGNEVVGPLSLVFAYVARERGGSFGREEAAAERAAAERAAAERAAAELERRYPEGVDGLRAGYVLLRRGLVCMGFPRESGGSAVAWTGYVPRRLRLRRRVVVLRRFADSIGYACLRRGVPVELGGRVVMEGEVPTRQQWESLLARLPAEFATAPRYLLVPRGLRSVVAAGMHPIHESRRPSLAPVLSGVRRPRRLRTPAAVNLLGALALVAAVVAAPAGRNATGEAGGSTSGFPVAGVPGSEVPGTEAVETGVPGTEAARGEDAAVSLGALGGALEPFGPRFRLREIRASGAELRVRGSGKDAAAVREVLDASGDFETVVIVSRRESGFVIEARYRGRPERITRPPNPGAGSELRAAVVRRPAEVRRPAVARLPRVRQVRGRRPCSRTPVPRVLPLNASIPRAATAAGSRYRIRAEASAEATAHALVGLTAAERGISVAVLIAQTIRPQPMAHDRRCRQRRAKGGMTWSRISMPEDEPEERYRRPLSS